MKTDEDKESPALGSPPLYSIGYGSRTVEQFIAALAAHNITRVVDVRTAPYSRFKPEFSKEPLEHALKQCGLEYVFLGDLLGGQPNDPECYADGKVDYGKLQTRPDFLAGIDRLKETHRQHLRAAIMCSEGRPEQCHRSKLIGEVLAAHGVPIQHIDEDGRLLTQFEVIRRLTGGQLDLFGPPAFTSRKRYAPGQSSGEEHPR